MTQTVAELAALFRQAADTLDTIPGNMPIKGDVTINMSYAGDHVDIDVSTENAKGVDCHPELSLIDALATATSASDDQLNSLALLLVNMQMRELINVAIPVNTPIAEVPALLKGCVDKVQSTVELDLATVSARLKRSLNQVDVSVQALYFTPAGVLDSIDYNINLKEII